MRGVLLCAPNDGATASYVRRGFGGLGWEVILWDYRKYAAGQASQGLAVGKMVAQTLAQKAEQADFVLVLKGESIPAEAMRVVSERVPLALWHFDPWDGKSEWVVERARAASAFFTIAKGLVPFYEAEGVSAHWLLEGADPEAHKPVAQVEGVERFPVGFVGTVKGVPGREAWLRAVNGACPGQVHTWGSFPSPLQTTQAVWYHGRAEPGDAGLSAVVSATDVSLGRDRNPTIERSYGARLFRTLAAGGFLLTNRTIGVEEDFNGCVETYGTDAECIELVRYWLKAGPEARGRVAARGRALVLEKHLFKHRVEELLKVMGF